MDGKNINLNWSYHIANIFARLGVKDICLCPGSRNTPLTIAFSNNSKFNCTSHIDERSAAFFAMGISKKINLPSIIISTSGTAVANFFPGIIESSLSRTPLIIITADRPKYLYNIGENQTINQQNIYGSYVREFQDIGLPHENINNLNQKIISSFNNCIGNSDTPPGPIHLNIPFEEPLVDDLFEDFSIIEKNKSDIKMKENSFSIPELSESIIICGNLPYSQDFDSILLLSEYLNAPILADPTSNIRYYRTHDNIISNYNFILDRMKIAPHLIIRFGKKPISKILCNVISSHENVLLVDKHNLFNDESNKYIKSDIKTFVSTIIESSDRITKNKSLTSLRDMQKKIDANINSLSIDSMMCEGVLINNILKLIKPNTNLFIGNSMAVREMDDLTNNLNKKINIFSNRGASGIDGITSTSLGIAHKSESNLNIAIMGDLSFYHDMNALLLASKLNLSMKFFILNNNGGGIFNNLKISKLNYKFFKKYWTTPLNLNFFDIAKLYNLKYFEIKNYSDLELALSDYNDVEIIDCKIDMDNTFKEIIISQMNSKI